MLPDGTPALVGFLVLDGERGRVRAGRPAYDVALAVAGLPRGGVAIERSFAKNADGCPLQRQISRESGSGQTPASVERCNNARHSNAFE
jgi:hypothetical protein